GLDAFDNAFGELVAAIVVVVCVIAWGESLLGTLWPHGFIECLAHPVQVYEWHVVFPGHLADCLGIVSVRVSDFALIVKGASLHRRNENRNAASIAGLGDEPLQIGLVRCERANSVPSLFFVVVSVLNE